MKWNSMWKWSNEQLFFFIKFRLKIQKKQKKTYQNPNKYAAWKKNFSQSKKKNMIIFNNTNCIWNENFAEKNEIKER